MSATSNLNPAVHGTPKMGRFDLKGFATPTIKVGDKIFYEPPTAKPDETTPDPKPEPPDPDRPPPPPPGPDRPKLPQGPDRPQLPGPDRPQLPGPDRPPLPKGPDRPQLPQGPGPSPVLTGAWSPQTGPAHVLFGGRSALRTSGPDYHVLGLPSRRSGMQTGRPERSDRSRGQAVARRALGSHLKEVLDQAVPPGDPGQASSTRISES